MSTRSRAKTSVYICLRVDVDGIEVFKLKKMAKEMEQDINTNKHNGKGVGYDIGDGLARMGAQLVATRVHVLSEGYRRMEARVQLAMRKHDTDDTVTPPATDEVRMDPRLVRRSGDDGTWVVQDQHTRIA